MEKEYKYLLSTRPLPKAVVEEAAEQGVVIETLSFISTQAIQNEDLFQKIKKLAAEQHTVIFTSMNAVEAVAAQAPQAPLWKIYSIGNTTRKLIVNTWGEDKLAATAEDAGRLAERLVDDEVREAVFFCGNRRRDELPNKLRSDGGSVEEIVVYETEETPVALQRAYYGILFFSPSAVQAFYQTNKPEKNTMLFAIGKTTAEALREQKAKNIVVGYETDKVALARMAVERLNHEHTKNKKDH